MLSTGYSEISAILACRWCYILDHIMVRWKLWLPAPPPYFKHTTILVSATTTVSPECSGAVDSAKKVCLRTDARPRPDHELKIEGQ
jgi:hypothetical protein